MKDPTNDKEKITYSCSGFIVAEDCSKKTNKQCEKDLGICLKKSGPLPAASPTLRPRIKTKDQKINKMVVNMGPDGTKDDVKIKICSDGNAVCCTSGKLSHVFSGEWVKNKQETWDAGDFGKCKKEVFKVKYRKL